MRLKDDGSEVVIMHVEDDPIARGLINKIIHMKFPGVMLVEAENGEIGVEIFNRYKPDIVLTDISMPILDGLAMAAEIMAIQPDTHIVALSALSDVPQYRLRAKEIGIDLFLKKPIDFNQLFHALEQYMGITVRH